MFGNRKSTATKTKERPDGGQRPGSPQDDRPRRRAAATVGAPVGAAAMVAGRHLSGSSGNGLSHSATNALAHHAGDGVSTEVAAAAVGAGAAAVAGASAATGTGTGAAGAGAAAGVSGGAATVTGVGAVGAGGASAATGAGAGVAAAGAGAAGGGAAGGAAGGGAAGQTAQTVAIGAVGVAAVATVVVVVATGDEEEVPLPEPPATTAAPAPAAPAPVPGPGVFEATATGALGADLFDGVDQGTEIGPLMVAGLLGEPTNVGVPVTLESGAIITVDPQGTFQYQPAEIAVELAAGETIVDEFSYVVTNADGFVEEWTATITVTGENDAPTVTPAEATSVVAGETATVALSATDPEADQLTFALAEGSPGFVTVTDAGDGTATLSLAPEAGSAGTYDLTVTVTDGGQPAMTESIPVAVTVTDAPEEPEPEAAPARVTEDLVALYNFGESSGAAVGDSSGSAPTLTVADPDAVTWNGGSVTIDSPTIITASGGSAAMVEAIKAANEFTVEAWITPANATQAGPARVVTLSSGIESRNVSLSQGQADSVDGDRWTTRQRSTATSVNGIPDLVAPAGSVTAGSLTHLVLTRSTDGDVLLYVNGSVVASGTAGGDLSNWDTSLALSLANETSMDRPWLGTIHLVALYSQSLSPDEVEQNRQVGG